MQRTSSPGVWPFARPRWLLFARLDLWVVTKSFVFEVCFSLGILMHEAYKYFDFLGIITFYGGFYELNQEFTRRVHGKCFKSFCPVGTLTELTNNLQRAYYTTTSFISLHQTQQKPTFIQGIIKTKIQKSHHEKEVREILINFLKK